MRIVMVNECTGEIIRDYEVDNGFPIPRVGETICCWLDGYYRFKIVEVEYLVREGVIPDKDKMNISLNSIVLIVNKS